MSLIGEMEIEFSSKEGLRYKHIDRLIREKKLNQGLVIEVDFKIEVQYENGVQLEKMQGAMSAYLFKIGGTTPNFPIHINPN